MLDIYNSADKAANAAAGLASAFDQEKAAISGFTSDGNDPADWAQWKQFFFQRLPQIKGLAANMQAWAKAPSPSAQAAAAAGKIPKPAGSQ